MLIRFAKPDDAGQLVRLIEQVENSNLMLFGPGERKITLEQQKKRIEVIKNEKNSAIFTAEKEGELIGYLFAIGGSSIRTRHTAYLVIGIAEHARGKGAGTRLFSSLEEWAKAQGIHRLELTVMVHNKAGIALYNKMGFEIEGTKRHSLLIDGEYVDELYMAKLI